METENTDYLQKNDLDKASFQHDMAYRRCKDLTKRTQSDKVVRDKDFEIASNPNYDGYQRGLASIVHKFFDKKSKGSGVATLANKSAIKSILNEQLANELHQPIIRNVKRRRVYSSFKNNIWGVNLADMQLTAKNNKGMYDVPIIFLVNMRGLFL